MEDSAPTDMEQFCSEFERRNDARPTLAALEKWGLAEVQTLVMPYLYAHGQSWPEDPDQKWIASAAGIHKKMADLAKRIQRFHQLPGSKEYMASLKQDAAEMERLFSNRPNLADAVGAESHSSQKKLVPLRLLALPGLSRFANFLEKLPEVLQAYASQLRIKSARRTADKKLVKSRVLYLLFLAVKRAESSKSDYQAHKSLAALLTPVRPQAEGVDYKTVANRITRFENSHSPEAEKARTVVAKLEARGVLQLAQLVESQRGFLLRSED